MSFTQRKQLTIHKDLSGGSTPAEGVSIQELTTDPDIYNDLAPVLDCGDIAGGTADSTTQQLFFDLKNQDGTNMDQVGSQPLRLFYASGRPPTGVTIEAVAAAAWADGGTDPAGAKIGNGETDALATSITTFGDAGAATGKNGYKYANIVVAASGVAASWTPTTDPKYGFVDYPLMFIEFPWEDKQDSGYPGYDDADLGGGANPSLVFVRESGVNGEPAYQFLGCSNRLTELLEDLAMEDVVKGKTAFDTVITTNNFNATFEIMSRSEWVLRNVFNFNKVETTTSFKKWQMPQSINLPVFHMVIRQQLKGGIARWWHFPQCNLIPDGTMGQDGTVAGAPVTLKALQGNVYSNNTIYPMDYELMALKYTVTVP